MRQGEREAGSGARLSGRDCGFRGEVCQGVGGVGGLVVLVWFGGGRKAARGLRMEVKMSLVRSILAGRRGKSYKCVGGQERFLPKAYFGGFE